MTGLPVPVIPNKTPCFDRYELRTGVFKDLERIKWHLWHGKVSLNVSAPPTPSGRLDTFFGQVERWKNKMKLVAICGWS